MQLEDLITKLNHGPVAFDQVIAFIESYYDFTPTQFQNGQQLNDAGTNNGSCKIFAFSQLNGLSQQATLNAFGDFYTKEVLENPNGDDHGNIRNFMQTGWDGIRFADQALQAKA